MPAENTIKKAKVTVPRHGVWEDSVCAAVFLISFLDYAAAVLPVIKAYLPFELTPKS